MDSSLETRTGVHTSSADDVGADGMGIGGAVIVCAAVRRAAAARTGAAVRTGAVVVRMGAAVRMRIGDDDDVAAVVAGVGVEVRSGLGRNGRALVVAEGSLAEDVRSFERTFFNFFGGLTGRIWLGSLIELRPALFG